MRSILFVLVLALAPLALLAPGAALAQADIATLEPLRDGDMKKLAFHSAPKPVSTAPFAVLDGGTRTLVAYRGKLILLNFWATWCAPCRKEMPSLDRLNAELGGEAFEVVTLATGRNAPQAMRRFFEEGGIKTLPLLNDTKQEVARGMAVLGLPVSLILNRDGQEIARLTGDAEWDSDSAKAILRALMDAGG